MSGDSIHSAPISISSNNSASSSSNMNNNSSPKNAPSSVVVPKVNISAVPPLMRQNSGKRILGKKPENLKTTKTLRMKSLLWIKPTITEAQLSNSSLRAQLIPALLVNLAALSSGLSLGYSAIALPQLSSSMDDAMHSAYLPFTLSDGDGSWIASMFGIGAIFGSLLSGILGSHLGRRKTLLIMVVPDILGWVLIAAAQNFIMMLVGRFLCGMAAAAYIPAIQIYISEIAQPHQRGLLAAITVPALALGSVLAYGLGAVLSWHVVAAVALVIPVLLVPALLYLSDSPYWYLSINQDRKALAVMERFRSRSANVTEELIAISNSFKGDAGVTPSVVAHPKELLDKLMQRKFRRPFLILNALFLLMTFSGKFAIGFYAVEILHKASVGLDEYLAAAVIGVIRLLGSLLYVPAIRKFSRRSLLCWSSFIMGCSLVLLGMSMYSTENNHAFLPRDPTDAMKTFCHWLPLLCVTLFTLADPIGLGSVPFLYSAEFFPSELRSLLSGITMALSNLEMFLMLKTFPSMMSSSMLGGHGTFWLYAGVCFATIVFTLLFVPETKGKTLEEIEGFFAHKESLHVTPFVTPAHTPSIKKKNSSAPGVPGQMHHNMSIQFTL